MKRSRHEENRRILGRVRRDEFVGRAAELEKLLKQATDADSRGLLIQLAPLAGVSELLRQAFDDLFNRQSEVVPIYFALPAADTTAVAASIEFLNIFLLQYIAFRRNEPSLCQTPLTLNDLVQLAPAADLGWVESLVSNYNQHRFGGDDREFVRFCLTAPQRVPGDQGRPFIMLDAVQLAAYADGPLPFATELLRALASPGRPFALAGLRRELLPAVESALGPVVYFDQIHLERLEDKDAQALVASEARRQGVTINDETIDLLVQQLEGSPFLLTNMLRAAHEKHFGLDSYLACERLYVDQLLGGRFHRYFATVLEHIAPDTELRRAVVALLCEAVPSGRRTASFDSWRKRLKVDVRELENVLRRLHAQELVNWDGETIDAQGASSPWSDYLRSRFRLDSLREPRALVVAEVMATALKRAPVTIARHFRRAASIRLRELLEDFNSQVVPKLLFEYDQFAESYRGATPEEINSGLDAETKMIRLPQVFYCAPGVSYSPDLRSFGEESCVVAHGFEGSTYTDQNEIVWLSARIESKLEAEREIAEFWVDLLEGVARKSGFVRIQIWLIAGEGFTSDAMALLHERGAYGSSQQQFEILVSRLGRPVGLTTGAGENDEIELVLPMGSDYELLAANTVEQIARRLKFRPEAINQIKTAIVEACINASEHSLSPDRKIYQRFRVENDKLVITIASRGIVPSNLNGHNRPLSGDDESDPAQQRRGWGLKLIKTLMDEVEFERVDEGTSLRMTKYVRNGS